MNTTERFVLGYAVTLVVVTVTAVTLSLFW
jgi:hypothetical protein